VQNSEVRLGGQAISAGFLSVSRLRCENLHLMCNAFALDTHQVLSRTSHGALHGCAVGWGL